MSTDIAVTEDKAAQIQIDRILASEELRSSEVLRRLLKFLADKSASGQADDLKEYVVAIEGLRKPPTYDPRQSSAVRIQVGRLRQKLSDYYRGEGKADPIVVDVPKGRFKLRFEHRTNSSLSIASDRASSSELLHDEEEPAARVQSKHWRILFGDLRFALPIWTAAVIALIMCARFWMVPFAQGNKSVSYAPGWDADMEDLWRPFVQTRRPLILAIEDPLFVEMEGPTEAYFRDRTLNDWKLLSSSHSVAVLRGVLKSPAIQPSRHFTAFGEVDASFMIAKLLGPREQNLSVVKTSDMPLQQLADNNVLFVGVENLFFNEQTQAMPVELQLRPVREGIRNVHPGPKEPAEFIDQYSTAPTEEGIAYALVTHLPGPLRDSDVESFTSSRSAGYVGAVKFFTDPASVHSIVRTLKQLSGGRMPRYYQVLLKVKFEKEMPTEITYVLARELH